MKSRRENSKGRRNFILQSLGVATSLAALPVLGKEVCALTPAQPEGPFYPENSALGEDNDLVWVKGKSSPAEGEIILIKGTVRDLQCQPVEGALVEIWQACHTGKYDHSGDPNPAKKDPNFQYWGQCMTDQNGQYLFRTVKPGAYPAGSGWVRPPHIHFHVKKIRYQELVTQLYFAGEALNSADLILRQLSKEEQEKVVRPLLPSGVIDQDAKICEFDVVLQPI